MTLHSYAKYSPYTSVCDWKALSLWKQNSRIKDEWRTSDLVIFWWNIPAINRYFLIGILICLQNGICDSWEEFFSHKLLKRDEYAHLHPIE